MSLPVVLICGCTKYAEFVGAAVHRLGKESNIETIAVVGGGTEASFNEFTKVLTLPVHDTYEGLPSKVVAAFEWVLENRPNCPGVFKTDDDILFGSAAELARAIEANQHRQYWGLMVERCGSGRVQAHRIANRFSDKSLRPTHQAALYCYGWGYWLSREALELAVLCKETYRQSYIEDVCTGFVMNAGAIYPRRVQVPYKEVERNQQLLGLD
jgi:Galactosyltransferase